MSSENRNILLDSEIFGSPTPSSSSLVDYRRILFRAIQYWYVMLMCILAAMSIAFLINRYTTKIYNVEASIIIKESQENNIGGQLLYNNALVEPYRNYYNELYIIKSLPLIQSVVDTLGFDISMYRQGDIKTSEFHDDNFPVKIEYNGMPSGEFQLILVDDSTFVLNASSNKNITNNSYYKYGEKIEIEKSKIVLSKRLNTIDESFLNKEYVLGFKNIQSVANRYRNRLGVSWQEQGASVVNLSLSGALPGKEMSFLKELTKQYQRVDLEKKNQAASRSIAFIDNQLRQISDSLRYFEFKVESFKKDNVVTNIDGEALRLYQRIEDLERQLGELTLKKNYLNYLTDYLTKDTSYDQVVPPSSVGVEDPIMTQLISNLVELQSTVQLNASLEKASTPLTQRKRDQIDKTKSDLLESVRSSLGAQKINENFLKGQIKFVENQLNRLPESERRLINLQRNYALSENLYIFMMQKRAEAGISKASTTSDIVVVNPPHKVGGPITPKPIQNYVLATAAGLFVPLLIFVIIELANQRVQSREDIENVTNIPLIGGVGHNTLDDNLIVYNKPKSSVAESFRALRSNLNFFTEGKEKKTFLITSSISGEGKTFSTINLATVLAFSGKKTLIVGADLRRPRLYNDFDLKNDIGLSNYLSGQTSLNEIAQTTRIENLDLVSGGPVPPNPSELLIGPKIDQFIKDAFSQYDFIILDSPPIGLVTDAFILSKHADHMLFLVRQNYTPKAALKTAQEFYGNGRINNVSIVFNDIRKVGPGYGYGYGYYNYDYGYGRNSKLREGGGYYAE